MMRKKLLFVFSIMSFLFLAVIAKAFYVQIVTSSKLIAYSDSQTMRTTKIYPKRGYILDRNENPLAVNIQTYDLFTFVKDEKNLKRDLKRLEKIIPSLNYNYITEQVFKRKKFTWIARKIKLSKKQFELIKDFKTIVVETKSSRFYPNHGLLGQTLGFVGVDNNGLAGIEYHFNKKLQGKAEIHKYVKDAKGRPIKFKSADFHKRSEDIVLSIDKEIQAKVEEYLKEGVEKHAALRGGAAVMDTETGEILAMANYPSFDPNYKKGRQNSKLAFVSDPFEPGSVFKALTIASALENNLVTESTSYFCENGKYRVDNHIIRESDSDHGFEWLSVTDILKYSSNIGTTKIAFDLTYPTLYETLKKFKIGEKSKIEIPGESRGILDDNQNVRPLRLSNISFGQGVATTGIQMLAAYSAFANGGYYVKPTILKVKDKSSIEKERIISKTTSRKITKMLTAAVEDGTGQKAQVAHFTIAGKTSTAQRVDPAGGYKGYIPGFLGYPVGVDKKIVVFVYIEDPKEHGYYGSDVAVPVFQKIVKSILYKNKNFKHFANVEKGQKDTLDKIHVKYSARRKIVKGAVPNLIGLDKSSAFKLLDGLRIDYKHRGFGIVGNQYPPAGTTLGPDTMVNLQFVAPSYE